MSQSTHRMVDARGLRMHVAEQGAGPAVLLCHGFPECWYSWRHQLAGLASAGYRAIAPDMRGYGESDAPAAADQYTIMHLVGDMVGLLDALAIETAAIVGHDWGAPVAWHAAMLRPDRFTAVAGLSVPFIARGRRRPTAGMPRDENALFYSLYFQDEGVAEAELDRNVRRSLRTILLSGLGAGAPAPRIGMVPRVGGFLGMMSEPASLPDWLGEADLDAFARSFEAGGFRGGLNWYRNLDRNWELLAAWSGAAVGVPALFIAGERDPVIQFANMDRVIAAMPVWVPDLRGSLTLPGCGHWTQQERPAEVTAALIEFLNGLRHG